MRLWYLRDSMSRICAVSPVGGRCEGVGAGLNNLWLDEFRQSDISSRRRVHGDPQTERHPGFLPLPGGHLHV